MTGAWREGIERRIRDASAMIALYREQARRPAAPLKFIDNAILRLEADKRWLVAQLEREEQSQ